MRWKKLFHFFFLSGWLMAALLGNSVTSYAQEIGRWVGETSEGFQFAFTITPKHTIGRIQLGYILTCESGREEPFDGYIEQAPAARIVNQRFVFGAPVRDDMRGNLGCSNYLILGEFTSPTEARGTVENLDLRFRVMEQTVGAQLCRTNDVTWVATFQPEGDDDPGKGSPTGATADAPEVGPWVGETSQGFAFDFTITPDRTIERIRVGFTLTCESGREETQPDVTFSRSPNPPIVDQRFVFGSPVSEDQRFCSNVLATGEFTSPTEAQGTFEYLDLRFRVVEQTVGAQLCRTRDVTWGATLQAERGGDRE